MTHLLVIGGGSIGERHVRCFLRTGRVELSLCEIRMEVCERLARDYALSSVYREFDEAIRSQPDAAVICTPAHLHVSQALRLAEAGVALLIEKPLSTSPEGVDELIETMDATDLPAAVAYVYRAHPALAAMKQAIDGGRFGRPVEVVVQAGQHFPFYRPAYRETYYASRETGGGAIQDALTHLVNAAEWLVGPATRVAADAEHCVLEGVSVEDTVHAITRHGDVLGSFALNQHQPANETTITVHCKRGSARFEMHGHRWLRCEKAGDDWRVEQEFALDRDDLFVRQAKSFLDVLDGIATPLCSITEAAQTLRVNLAMLKSAEQRVWLDIQ